MNLTIFTGNLTKDPELMQTSSGSTYCNFTVAVNGESNDSEGNRQTYFFPCTAWKNRGENIAKYCKKGSKVLVRGEMQSRTYTDKEGAKKTAWNLVVSNIEFLGSKQDNNSVETEEQPKTTTKTATRQRPYLGAIEDDNALPF